MRSTDLTKIGDDVDGAKTVKFTREEVRQGVIRSKYRRGGRCPGPLATGIGSGRHYGG
jgi:hypothetical protein